METKWGIPGDTEVSNSCLFIVISHRTFIFRAEQGTTDVAYATAPSEPCKTKSRSRPVPGMLFLTFRRYVTLTWMKFRMRIGPPSGRTRQDPEGRKSTSLPSWVTRKICLREYARHRFTFFFLSFSLRSLFTRWRQSCARREYVAKTWVSRSEFRTVLRHAK